MTTHSQTGSFDLSALNNLNQNLTQYFWFEEGGSGSYPWGLGAHVTLYPQSEFTNPNDSNYLKGQNILINTDGFSLRNGTIPLMVVDNDSLDFNLITNLSQGTYVNVATFGATGATIGQLGAAHSVIDANGQRFYGGSNGTKQLANIGYGETQGQSGTTDSPYYTLGQRATTVTTYKPTLTYSIGDICKYDEQIYVCISDISTPESWTPEHWQVSIGNYSMAEGQDNVAGGWLTHVEGRNNKVLSSGSHVEGAFNVVSGAWAHVAGSTNTVEGNGAVVFGDWCKVGVNGTSCFLAGQDLECNHSGQTVVGRFNDNKQLTLFEIGNGSPDGRSNAFTVDVYGNVEHGNLELKQTTIAGTNPAELKLSVHQTNNNVTSSGYIRVYDDYDSHNYGTNMVIQSGGNMIVGSGESPQTFYDAGIISQTSEEMYITSDDRVLFVVNCNGGIANRKVATINADGSINIPSGANFKIGGTNLSAADVEAIPDSPKTSIIATHVANNGYCTSSATGRISLMRPSKYIGILRFNLTIDDASMPTGTADVHIATLSGVALAGDVLFAVPPQVNGRGTLIVSVNQSGQIKISNYSGVANSGFYRALVPLYLTT